jgi:hypothetical protein
LTALAVKRQRHRRRSHLCRRHERRLSHQRTYTHQGRARGMRNLLRPCRLSSQRANSRGVLGGIDGFVTNVSRAPRTPKSGAAFCA